MEDIENIAKVAAPEEAFWLEIKEKAEEHAKKCLDEAKLNTAIAEMAQAKANAAAD